MINLATARRRFLLGVAVAFFNATAFAATYNISLFEGATGTGSGSFVFTNAGTAGSFPVTPVTLSTNGSSTIGARTFTPGSLNVQVFHVDFIDGKTPSNKIAGNFVEGLTGNLSAPAAVEDFPNCAIVGPCVYKITFDFTGNSTPSAALKTYRIEVISTRDPTIIVARLVSGTYAVSNTSTIPEPGGLALLALGLVALAWHQLHRRQRLAT